MRHLRADNACTKWNPNKEGQVKPNRVSSLMTLGLALVVASCYPGDVSSVSELDVVATVRDQSANFGTISTFALPDTIIHLDIGEGNQVELSRAFDDLILSEVVTQLEALGYMREADPLTNGADAVVLVSAFAVEQTNAYVSYPWWNYWGSYPGWGFWPGYGPGWGWGYPPTVSTVSYEQGTLLISLIDVNNPDTQMETLPIIWVAAASGILSSAGVSETRLVTNIRQAFIQSPYLGTQ